MREHDAPPRQDARARPVVAGTQSALDVPARTYPHPDGTLTVAWYPARCTHSGHCARSLGVVFAPKRRPWIEPGAADAATVAAVVRGCPSGALQVHEDATSAMPPLGEE